MLALIPLVHSVAVAEAEADGGAVLEPFRPVEFPWLTAAVMELPFYWFYLGGPAIHGQAYLPNFHPRLGVRINYKEWGAQVTAGVPLFGRAEQERRGDSTQSGGAINTYWRENAMDLYYQAFRGFYVSDPFTELKPNKPSRYPQLPDTQVLNLGFNWYHALDPARYSLKAAFDHQEFQLSSGGSWVLNPFLNHFEMRIGRAFVAGTDPDAVNSLPNLASGRYDTIGLALGYGHTFIRRRYFLTTQGTLGPGLQYQRIDRTDGTTSNGVAIAAKFNVNLSAGWNDTAQVGGMKILVDSLSTRVVNVQLTSSLITAQFFYGLRF